MKRFQNRVAESPSTLYLVAIYAAFLIVGIGLLNACEYEFVIPVLAVSTLVVMEINNRNLLLRIRSRLLSCTVLMLTLMTATVTVSLPVALLQLAFVGMLFLLLLCCQRRDCVGVIFYAMLLISCSSLLWIKMLWLVPIMMLLMIKPLYCISWKALSAIVMAVILPYFVCAATVFLNTKTLSIDRQLSEIKAFGNKIIDTTGFLDYTPLTAVQISVMSLLALLFVVGTFHFIRFSYLDKIRVRVIYWTFIELSLILFAAISLFPVWYGNVVPLLCVPVGALTAHYFAHTSSKFTNVLFIIVLVAVVAVTAFSHLVTLGFIQ